MNARARGWAVAGAVVFLFSTSGCGGGGGGGDVPVSLSVTVEGAGAGVVSSAPAGITCGDGGPCSASFTAGAAVTLTATPAAGSAFGGWFGDCSGTATTCTVTLSAAAAVTARFDLVRHRVTVLAAGNGLGTVFSAPAGIDCPGVCVLEVDHGTPVILSATASGGSTFLGWSGACSGTGPCALTVTDDLTVGATFGENPSLGVARSGDGAGVVTSVPAGIDCGADCTEVYAFGQQVTLSAAPAGGSEFTGWSGDCTGAADCTLTLDAPKVATAGFALLPYALTVERGGTGTGSVTSSPAGIDCGADCTEPYLYGTSVTLTAAPAAGSVFAGWSGGGCTGTGTCDVTVTAATTVTATFTLAQYNLIVTKAGTGLGTVTSLPAGINCGPDCAQLYDYGTTVMLTATPSAGAIFAGWSGGGCTGISSCTVPMTAATTVTATFDMPQQSLTVTRAGTGTGTVTSNPAGITCGADCTELYDFSSTVTLTAAPAAGSVFAGWSGGGCTGTGTCTVTLTAAKSVTATFNLAQYSLNVTKAGTGTGTVTSNPAGISCGVDCTEVYNFGTLVTLTAAPAAGSAFAGWSGGGCTGTGTCTVTVNAATSVTATFNLAQYTLGVVRAGAGTGTVTSSPAGITCGADCTQPFDVGSLVTLTAAPAAGSVFAGWSGGGCSGTGTCTVTVNAATTVTATFNLTLQSLSVTRAGTGTGTVTSSPAGITCGVDCTQPFNYGSLVTLTAVAAVGSTFAGWSGGGCTGTGTCIVTVNAATTVTATFNLAQFTLSVTRSGAGTGTVTSSPAGITCGADCAQTFNYGTPVVLTASATVGSSFAGWSGGGCSGTGTCTVTVTGTTTVNATFTTP